MAIRVNKNNSWKDVSNIHALGKDLTKVYTGEGKLVWPDGQATEFTSTPSSYECWSDEPLNYSFNITSTYNHSAYSWKDVTATDMQDKIGTITSNSKDLITVTNPGYVINEDENYEITLQRDVDPKELKIPILVKAAYILKTTLPNPDYYYIEIGPEAIDVDINIESYKINKNTGIKSSIEYTVDFKENEDTPEDYKSHNGYNGYDISGDQLTVHFNEFEVDYVYNYKGTLTIIQKESNRILYIHIERIDRYNIIITPPTYYIDRNQASQTTIATFTVDSNDGHGNSVPWKLVDFNDLNNIGCTYVRNGDTVKITVPPHTYEENETICEFLPWQETPWNGEYDGNIPSTYGTGDNQDNYGTVIDGDGN